MEKGAGRSNVGEGASVPAKSSRATASGHTDLSKVLRRTLLLASDFDGSIVPDHLERYHEDKLVVSAAERIRKLSARGFRFATVTGSRLSRVKPWSDMSNSPLFAENAGVVYDPQHPSDKPRILIDSEESDLIIKVVAPKIDAFLDANFPGYTRSEGKLTMATYHKPESASIQEFKDALLDFISSMPPDIKNRIFTTYSHTLVDVNHKGASKARAIRFMSEFFGIGADRFTVYGDGDNDRPAFDAALRSNGTVVVPANRDNEVGKWLSGRKGDERIAVHHLESTECLLDLLRELERK